MSFDATVLADSPILYALLAEPSGTTCTDSSTNAHDGTYTGGPTLGVPSIVPSDAETCATFVRASTQYALFTNIAAYAVGDTCSIMAVIKTNNSGSNIGIASWGAIGGNAGMYLRMDGDGTLEVLKSQTASMCNPATTANDNVAHVIHVTKTGTTFHMYKDAVDFTSGFVNATLTNPVAGPIGIGCDPNNGSKSDPFNGTLARVAFFNTALSQTRVTAHNQAFQLQVAQGQSRRVMQAVRRSAFI